MSSFMILERERERSWFEETNACAGYTSNAAAGLRDALLTGRSKTAVNVHARVLGNVIYLMASLTTSPRDLNAVSEALRQRLDQVSGIETGSAQKELYEGEVEDEEDLPVRTP